MSNLAKEVDGSGQYGKACLHNLQTLAPFGRMMLAGMLGDLTADHLQLVPGGPFQGTLLWPRPPQHVSVFM